MKRGTFIASAAAATVAPALPRVATSANALQFYFRNGKYLPASSITDVRLSTALARAIENAVAPYLQSTMRVRVAADRAVINIVGVRDPLVVTLPK